MNFRPQYIALKYLNINGRIANTDAPVLHADNRSFRYGYGLFETMLLTNGEIQRKDLHWERLFKGMKQLGFDIPVHLTAALLEEQVLRTVDRNNAAALCRVRLQVFPGNGGLYDGDSFQPEYIIECFPLEEHIAQLNENGLVAGIAEGLYKSADSLSHLKTSNALVYAAAARQAKQYKWNDALITNTAGHIIESTIANIFWIKNEQVYTPPLSEGCIAGVMRHHIIQSLSAQNRIVQETPLTKAMLVDADEVFLSNAIRRIKWVKETEDRVYSNTFTQKLYNAIFGA